MLHAGAALIKLSDMECTGPVIHFIKVLLQKRYALPGRVLASVCKFFYKLIMDDRRMPVMWHQALLTLAQYYGKEIEPELKDEIRELIKIHNHPQITPEIRKYLFNEGRE
ncbi:unnamed protein product [Blepharisma stoltei]|uniref:Bystin n=1 Tax=Blepharisma stoltei TaxID=1481888 RepID=A0AAU9IUD0_9CILI|nr:unnamed protein product [Blepharisma stoltei]